MFLFIMCVSVRFVVLERWRLEIQRNVKNGEHRIHQKKFELIMIVYACVCLMVEKEKEKKAPFLLIIFISYMIYDV